MKWILLSNATVDGAGDPVAAPSVSSMKTLSLKVTGTFDGATVTLERSTDSGVTWVTHGAGSGAPASWSSAVDTMITAPKGRYRGVVSGAGGSTSVSMEMSE